ncbi:MAG: IS66 family insertion sequence element accessory protein TnpB [Alteromonadaceae bacterium]|nr:IS66 family insertion sequence element accessory protein TnpB [Alteromonadaceae bacterium]
MIKLTTRTPILLGIAPAALTVSLPFVVANSIKTMIRALTYGGTGFWLMTKRLSKRKFTDWPKGLDPISKIAAIELKQMLSGHDRSRFSQINEK